MRNPTLAVVLAGALHVTRVRRRQAALPEDVAGDVERGGSAANERAQQGVPEAPPS